MTQNTRLFLLKWFNRLDRMSILRILPDGIYLKILFRLRLNKTLNLKKPKTFNEKLQWIKLYDRKTLYTSIVDKYSFKKFISEKIGEEFAVPCIGGPWYSATEIDFDCLPEQFVLKTNHDSGGVIICRDKSTFDFEKAREFLKKHLKKNYYWIGREWPYKDVKPCVFAEELLDDGSDGAIHDYKFFCFGGQPKIMYLSRDKAEEPKTDFFDMNYQHLDMRMRDQNDSVIPEKPKKFEEMKVIATELSKDIPHVRVDFYMVGDRLYVGEMTFVHCGGFVQITPEMWEDVMGDWIELS